MKLLRLYAQAHFLKQPVRRGMHFMAEDLIPVFMPALAELLAHAEQLKKSPLTEAEVVRLRDAAVTIAMKQHDAEIFLESRGFRDVNPHDCWADWHRLRVEFTGNGSLPRIVLCILGGEGFPEACAQILAEAGLEHGWQEHNPQMVNAFNSAECRVRPSLKEEDWRAITEHTNALYVLSNNFTASQAPTVSLNMLLLGRRLLEAGGCAIKCDSSSIGHSRTQWIEFANQAESATISYQLWSPLFSAFVRMPIGNANDFYTIGMHLLGKPDLIIGNDLVSDYEAVDLFSIFALYLLAECPDGDFASGNTFKSRPTVPPYRVVWEPCVGYDEDEFPFNPFGRWRFTAIES